MGQQEHQISLTENNNLNHIGYLLIDKWFSYKNLEYQYKSHKILMGVKLVVITHTSPLVLFLSDAQRIILLDGPSKKPIERPIIRIEDSKEFRGFLSIKDKHFIYENYKNKSAEQMAIALNKSVHSVNKYKRENELFGTRGRRKTEAGDKTQRTHWTPQEDELIVNASENELQEIATQFNRRLNLVQLRKRKLLRKLKQESNENIITKIAV